MTRRRIAVALATLGFLTFNPLWAEAASFSWSATIAHAIRSRDFRTTARGDIVIQSFSTCAGAGISSYTIALYGDSISPLPPGKVSYACGRTLQFTWTNKPVTTYFFIIEKSQNGKSITLNGVTTYR